MTEAKTLFRPCIDLHEGMVKQIVGGTLDSADGALETNFVASEAPAFFADRYREDQLTGGHVIKLGLGNDSAARSALAAYAGGLQIGGGINPENASEWLDAGASHVIATSCLFDKEGRFLPDALDQLTAAIGANRLVIDLSCRRTDNGWVVAMNRWQTLTDLAVTNATLDQLADQCDEFLIHAADVEGKCGGIDEALVEMLGAWGKTPMTYAGGARAFEDLAKVQDLSNGTVDLTIGSALDLFGGSLIRYEDCVAWNHRS